MIVVMTGRRHLDLLIWRSGLPVSPAYGIERVKLRRLVDLATQGQDKRDRKSLATSARPVIRAMLKISSISDDVSFACVAVFSERSFRPWMRPSSRYIIAG
jgi:hypothetical protein